MNSTINSVNTFKSYGGMDAGLGYARLGSYTMGYRGIRPPIPSTTVSGYYVVPSYAVPGYSTLTHGAAGSGGPYFQIGGAYGVGAANCATKYMGSMCM